jgi:uncharacterized protein (UPF0147 family)
MSQSNGWDVSNILLQNRSGEILGQGMANLGQQAGSTFEKYGKIKQENQAMEGTIKQQATTLESIFKNISLPQNQRELAAKSLLNLNDPNASVTQRHAAAIQSAQDLSLMVQLGTAAMQQRAEAARLRQTQFEQYKAISEYNNIMGLSGGQPYMYGQDGGGQVGPVPAQNTDAASYITRSGQGQPPAAQPVPQAVNQTQAGAPAMPQGGNAQMAAPGGPPVQAGAPAQSGGQNNGLFPFFKPNKSTALAINSDPSFGARIANILHPFIINYASIYHQLPSAEMQTAVVNAAKEVVKPGGWIEGNTSYDKDNNQVTNWRNVVFQDNGSRVISPESESITRYTNMGAPGIVLDAKNDYKPLPQQPPSADLSQAAKLNHSEAWKNAYSETINDLRTIQDAQDGAKRLVLANRALAQNRSSRLMPLTGTALGNKLETTIFGDTSGDALNAESSKLVANLMGGDDKTGGVKNAKNIQVFKAVTANLPNPSQPEDVRLDRVNDVVLKLNRQARFMTEKLKNLESGQSPEDAESNAMKMIKGANIEEAVKALGLPLRQAAAGTSPKSEQTQAIAQQQAIPVVTTQADFEKLPSGKNIPFYTPSGKLRHKP